ncbi:hypothetical protein D3261_12445 [Halococcus sp. IIIV-5B]|nr:hypothetical protein D3261_12445 [Halococcus sp. IIIV-5B]
MLWRALAVGANEVSADCEHCARDEHRSEPKASEERSRLGRRVAGAVSDYPVSDRRERTVFLVQVFATSG